MHPRDIKNPFFNKDASALLAIPDALISGIGFAQDMGEKINYYRDMMFRDPNVTQNGFPNYSGVSNLRGDVASIQPDQAGKGFLGQGAMTGLKAGVTIGSMFSPVGAGIGAAVGALAGTLGGLFGRKKARQAAGEAKQEGLETFQQAQGR